MANLDMRVNETLGITGGTGDIVKEILHPAPRRTIAKVGDDADIDYKYSRDNF